MRKMLVIMSALVLVLMAFITLSTPFAAHTENVPMEIDLIAGGGNPKSAIDVGSIEVWNDGEYLYVKYVIEDTTPDDPNDNWYITETHLAVEEFLKDIPQNKKHNLKIGHFEYSEEHDHVTEYTYEIDLEWVYGKNLYIAAHAVVEKVVNGDVVQEETAWGAGFTFNEKNWATYFNYEVQVPICLYIFAPVDGEQVTAALSDTGSIDLSGTVHIMVEYPYEGAPSYFKIYVDTGGGYETDPNVVGWEATWEHALDGWCVDIGHSIYQWTAYEVDVYKCEDKVPDTVVDIPDNLPIVKYILEKNWVGQDSGEYGDYTYGDVQRAIWEVIDISQSTILLEPWNPNRVNLILTDAGYL